jgi:hypothetical protein
MTQQRIFPIGIQHFESLRERGRVYVDKTALIHQLVTSGEVYFLSRPRRFGKSLLVSTLQAYFEGQKELFDGLAMEKLETEWTQHPVLLLSFAMRKYGNIIVLHRRVGEQLREWESSYGRGADLQDEDYGGRFAAVIRMAYEKTGQKTVVLIDEYDSPMLDSMNNPELQKEIRGIIRNFFSPLKDCGKYMRFLFLTGISKFSQLSIFSELNNLKNISMIPDYAAICGIMEEELLTQLAQDVQALAEKNGETYEEACAHLKYQYDGYHFCHECAGVYNPFSLINVLNDRKYHNYWYSTGTPTFLVEMLAQMDFDPRLFENEVQASDEDFDQPTETLTNPLPVLYQSGYLTIKDYDPMMQFYTLGYPNEEVRLGVVRSLIPTYFNIKGNTSGFYAVAFLKDLQAGDIDSCMKRTQAFYASVPYDKKDDHEKRFELIFYMLFTLMGQFVRTEVHTDGGRADVVVHIPGSNAATYVIEFKVDSPASEAIAQIKAKGYDKPYRLEGKKVVCIGVGFDKETRTLSDWIVE